MKQLLGYINHGSGYKTKDAASNNKFIINLQNVPCIKQKPKNQLLCCTTITKFTMHAIFIKLCKAIAHSKNN